MSDLLQQASDWLEGIRHQHASQAVTYHRGTDSVPLHATVGKTDYEVEDEYGFCVKAEVVDFLIRADDLVMAGQKTLPQLGDQIRFTRGEQIMVFEVMALAGQSCWRYSDSFGQTLRIHTKQVGAE